MEETFDLSSLIPEEEQLWLEEMLRGDPKDVAGLGAMEAEKLTEATVPVIGQPMCPVPACQGEKFTRTTGLRRHWRMIHMPTVVMYHCVVEGCRVRHPRADKVATHLGKDHKAAFQTSQGRLDAGRLLPQTVMQNRKFLHPGMSPPATVGELLAPEASNTTVKKIPANWRTLGPAPNQEITSPKKRKREEVPTYVPSKILRRVVTNTKEEEDDLIKQVPQKELLFRFYKNQAQIDNLGRQNKLLKGELKRRELEEASKDKDIIKGLLQEIKEQKDIIRKRDRTIRHLESGENIL